MTSTEPRTITFDALRAELIDSMRRLATYCTERRLLEQAEKYRQVLLALEETTKPAFQSSDRGPDW